MVISTQSGQQQEDYIIVWPTTMQVVENYATSWRFKVYDKMHQCSNRMMRFHAHSACCHVAASCYDVVSQIICKHSCNTKCMWNNIYMGHLERIGATHQSFGKTRVLYIHYIRCVSSSQNGVKGKGKKMEEGWDAMYIGPRMKPDCDWVQYEQNSVRKRRR